jgi:predicted HD phosphohydrolase
MNITVRETVDFIAMKDGTKEEYEFLDPFEREHAAGTADRLLAALHSLDGSMGGYKITRLGHSLQSATRAWRDGADDDWVVAALLHDIGDTLAAWNHAAFAASILKPFVREQCTWVVEAHGDFQKQYYAHHFGKDRLAPRRRYEGSPYFDDCDQFCERWDQSSFDPDYDTSDLAFFEPMLKSVFARAASDPVVVRVGEREPLVVPGVAAERA